MTATLTVPPRAVLIDIAGVLHVGDQAIPGAVAALARLRASGIPLRFLTNTTRSPRAAIVGLLQGLGFAIDADEVHTAVLATRQLVEQRGWRAHWLVHPDILDDIAAEPQPRGGDNEVDAVVLGDAGEHFTFDRLNTVFRLVMAGKPWLAMAHNRYYQAADGLTIDLGAFVAAIEYASGRTAEVAGKPAASFFLGALAELGVAPADAVVIGDDLHADIVGAQMAGIPSVLVRTGKFRPGDEDHPDIRPAAVVADFAAAVELLLGAARG